MEKYKIYGFRRFLAYSTDEIYNRIWIRTVKKSFSQVGEDLVIDRLLGNKKSGFYVDIGAYDPNRFSNTRRFYLKGWCGINIEPDANKYKKFVKERKRDINLNIGIGKSNTDLAFFQVFPDTLSTFSKAAAKRFKKEGFRLVGETSVEVRTLSDVLAEHCGDKTIDFMSVDAEGYDLVVLESNDWAVFRPRVICVETTEPSARTMKRNTEVEKFLLKHGYRKHSDIGPNSIFLYANIFKELDL